MPDARKVFYGGFDGNLRCESPGPGPGHPVGEEGEAEILAYDENILVLVANPPHIRSAYATHEASLRDPSSADATGGRGHGTANPDAGV